MFNDMVDLVYRKAGELDALRKLAQEHTESIQYLSSMEIIMEDVRNIFQLVGQKTQEQIVVHVSDIVNAALGAVFGLDAYGFGLEFVKRRGKTEADIFFIRGGDKIDPMTAAGGGAVDVAAFALRVALWTLVRSSNTIILDEPFRFLSKSLQPKAGEMLKMLSEKMGLQFIFVTHVKELMETADRVFQVNREGKESKVVYYG
jgi:DNA repair exonuclease SbcCD ATPase subunit